MKINRKHRLLVAAMTTILALAVTSTAAWAQGPGYGSGMVSPAVIVDATEAEADALSYMREEEKLARDVYTEMHEVWGVAIFNNIAASEQTHMDAVGTLLDRYGVEDPAANTAPGEFANVALQQLYDDLVAMGSASLEDALSAGAAIEEIDILDLGQRLEQTEKADIQLVYENLLRGSGNHLRAFVSLWEQQTGETYEPQYLSTSAYDTLPAATGQRRGGNGANGGWGMSTVAPSNGTCLYGGVPLSQTAQVWPRFGNGRGGRVF